MLLAYEDRMKGKMPEDICIGFMLTETENTTQSADKFICNIKKYLETP